MRSCHCHVATLGKIADIPTMKKMGFMNMTLGTGEPLFMEELSKWIETRSMFPVGQMTQEVIDGQKFWPALESWLKARQPGLEIVQGLIIR